MLQQSQRDRDSALNILVAFSRAAEAREWAKAQAESHWGPIVRESPCFDFVETEYYRPAMGENLQLVIWAFERLWPTETIVERKLQTGTWEAAYAEVAGQQGSRPLNLDPGYLTLAKFVLASTKDHAHRLHLGQGIYGEVTLSYQHGRWQPHLWTYPNYRRDDYQRFLTDCRDWLRNLPRPGAAA